MTEEQRRALEQEVWVSGSSTARVTEKLVFSRAEVGMMGKEVLANHIQI